MPSALWIAHVHVTDAEAYGRYAKGATEAIQAHGGVFLARGGRYVQLEGNDRPRNVVAGSPAWKRRSSATTLPTIRPPLPMRRARPSVT